jgi:hypothetical protein
MGKDEKVNSYVPMANRWTWFGYITNCFNSRHMMLCQEKPGLMPPKPF